MNTMLLKADAGSLFGLGLLGIIALAVVAAFVVVSILATIWKWVLMFRYVRYNKQKVAVGMTGAQVAEKMLEGLGLTDVKVARCGFFSEVFLGNSYSPRKKLIRLRRNIYDKTSLTAVALAAQKVAIAQKHHEGDKKIALRSTLMTFGYFAPFAVLPLILVGFLLDFVIWRDLGVFSIIFTAVAFAYYISSFIVLILNIKIEKRACNTALEFMQKINLLVDDEVEDAQHLYKTYITNYWLDFISELLYIVWSILKFVGKVVKREKK